MIWEFMIDDDTHKLEMFDSVLSGKKKVMRDGLTIKEDDGYVIYAFSLKIY